MEPADSESEKPCLSPQVVTFDAGGVSGHSNHIALHAAVRYDSPGEGRGRGFVHLLKGQVAEASPPWVSEAYETYR